MRSAFNRLSIKQKFLYILSGGILFLSVISFLCFHSISKTYEKALYQSVSNTLSYSSENILLKTKNIEAVSEQILGDQSIQTYLSDLCSEETLSGQNVLMGSLYRKLTNYLFSYDRTINISSISILTTNDFFVSTASNQAKTLPEEVLNALVEKAVSGDGASVWFTGYADSYGVFLVKEIKQTDGLSLLPLGYLMIKVDISALMEQSVSYLDSDHSAYLLSAGADTLYKSSSFSPALSDFLDRKIYGYRIMNLDHTKYFAVYHRISGLGWDYFCMLPYNSIFLTIRIAKALCIFAFVFCLFSTLFVSSRLLGSLLYSIDLLVKKMKAFGNNTYSASDFTDNASERPDEIGLLHRTFDDMVSRINTLVFDNYANELLRRDAQIKAMENQINPHFLYNTLDTINWKAKAIGAQDIMKISQSLGSLLRVTLKSTDSPYTISEELAVLQSYITIQQQRYGEKLDFQSSVPQEYYGYRIPKLMLQPLLENAIYYGLEESTDICHISLKAFRTQEFLVFQVKNSGSSFEEDLLEKLRTKEILPHGHGIGLLNIDKRLKLTYGDAYGLRLYNRDDLVLAEEYAVAELCLPLPDKEDPTC